MAVVIKHIEGVSIGVNIRLHYKRKRIKITGEGLSLASKTEYEK